MSIKNILADVWDKTQFGEQDFHGLQGGRRRWGVPALIVAVSLGLLSGPAHAATYYWDTTTTGLWATGANWSDTASSGGTTGVVPLSTDSVVFNQSSVNGAETVQLNAATSIAGITFANTGTTLLDSDSVTSRTLTVGSGGITVNSGAGAVTLGNATNLMPVALNGNQSWANNSSSLLTVVNGVTNSSTSTPVTLTVNGSGAGGTTFSGVISNNTATTAVVVNTTGGTTTFSGANTFSGGFTLNSGNVKSTATTGLGTVGSALNLNGGTLELASMSGATTSATIKTAAVNTTTVGGNTTIISNRAAAGSVGTDYQLGGLTIGAYTLTADKGANVTGGALARVSFFGALTLTGNATFDAKNGTLMVLNNDATAGTPSVKLTGDFNMTFQSSDGTGTISLRCPYASTRSSGVTTLNSGILALNSNAAGSGLFFGSTTGTSLVLNGGTLDLQTVNAIGAYNTTVGGNVTVKITNTTNAQTLGTLSMGAQTMSVTGGAAGSARLGFGATTLTGNATYDVALGTATTTTLTLGGVSDGGNGYGITKTGAQTMILSGTSTYSGATNVNAGTLRAGSTTGFSGNSAVTMANVAGATLDLNGNNSSIGSLAGGGATGGNVTLGSGTLTTGGDNTSTSYDGVISGTGGLTKTGSGTQTLSRTNTYTGATTVNAGTLLISGTVNTSSGVTVNGGTFNYTNNTTALNRAVTVAGGNFKYNSTQAYTGTLTFTSGIVSGSGNLSGTALTLGTGQTLSPGNSPGTLSTGAQTWANGGSYLWEINALATSSTPGTEGANPGWDFANISGALSITAGVGQFNLNVDSLLALDNWDSSGTYQWRIATATGGVTGFNANIFNIDTSAFSDQNSISGGSFSVSNVGNDVFLNYTAVPEPSTFAMLGVGLVGLWALRRKSNRGF